ncbi:hypothetical protein B0F90DRAFT_1909375 [Multifurca ochricompacta]|uniref:Uncharacterized protein n=1 Tax=Multifurca ochricompacta TaxID=376703 RepID=A0AAD4MDB2_9AGAM|nr:hypothetical protein B0F90DRAFT_1909375 [Multifurca ochricompacta]
MSDDDRAAKTARAKALLNKKRQQKKPGPVLASGAITGASTVSTPGSPLVRARSPPLADSSDEVKPDVTEILSTSLSAQDLPEPEWLTSLARVGTPSIVSPRENTPPVNSSSSVSPLLSPAPRAQAQPSLLESIPHEGGEELENLRAEVQNQRQTITLLVSEKMSLSASLGRLSDVSARASEVDLLLRDKQATSKRFQEQILQLENEAQQRSATIEKLSQREKEFEDKCRDQERELRLTRSSMEGLKIEAERSQSLIRELQERLQSEDRVGQLEASLQNVQDRASELEFQLSKSKQVNVSLKVDHDRIESELKERATVVASLEMKISDLEGRHVFAQKQLASLTAEHQALRLEKSALQSQISDHLGTIAGLRKSASQSTSNQEVLNRQLQSSHAELRNAIRRAENAERMQQELQTEIVELTNVKLELSEKANALEQVVRDQDGVIAQLESSLQATQDQNESLNTKLLEAETAREKDRSTAQETQDELQRGYAQLEVELSDALASIRELEVERAGQRQLANKHVEDLDRIVAASQSLKVEIASLHQELEERKLAEVEQQDFLERARTDIEVLRADLVVKVQEIDELRAELSTTAANSASPSLDKEMVNALRQQHRLELSAAQSQIRALQTSVFEAEARAHSFQKQLSQSEDQLAQLRALSRAGQQRPFSPVPDHPSRPSSRARNHSDDLRRASLTQRRGSNGVPLGAPHLRLRKVSLGMLKARIDSEMAVVGSSIPPSLLLDSLTNTGVHNSHKRPQFLDESHIFWCHSCRGELVVL